MSSMSRKLGLLAVALVAAWGVRVRAGDDDKGGVEAKAAFERLKTLAGEWKVHSKNEHFGGDHATIRYQVTAAGSVVMETQFPGADHEMISMYFLDGDNLLMTHYCAAKNQPRLKLDKAKSTADHLVFDFDGGTNLDPEKDTHIHAARITLLGKDKIQSEWDAFAGKEKLHCEAFELSR